MPRPAPLAHSIVARNMLSEFYIVVEDFQSGLKACGQALAESVGIDHIQRHRMSDLGQDMVSFSESLVRAHINATMWMLDATSEAQRAVSPNPPDFEDLYAFISGDRPLDQSTQDAVRAHLDEGRKSVERMVRRQKSRAAKRSEEAVWELKASYKAYFFFIRAFHDACYGVLLNLGGSTPGAYSSMNQCIKKKVSPFFEQIGTIPGYVDWFNAFRQKRDLIKRGVNFSLCGPQWDVGVGFNSITPAGGLVVSGGTNGNNFRLGDLISAFRYSAAMVELISGIVPQPNSTPNPDAG